MNIVDMLIAKHFTYTKTFLFIQMELHNQGLMGFC